jgi:hypothetical protein
VNAEPLEGGEATGPDEAIRVLLKRLGRPHASGGVVVERASVLAEGADFAKVMEWIVEHDGTPEAAPATATRHGLHGSRLHDSGGTAPRVPLRYVLPVAALA